MALDEKPALVLINPWIHDFAAYDLWSKPLGLLYLAGALRDHGYKIHFLDCLDIHHPGIDAGPKQKPATRHEFGKGRFLREQIPRPEPLKHIKRPFHRYGIHPDLFVRGLSRVRNPLAILVTSLMTYWYPGVQEAVRLARSVHPDVPVILGGVYARLCARHARDTSGADHVVEEGGTESLSAILRILHQEGGEKDFDPASFESLLYPALDLYSRLDYVPLLTSLGCPYHCDYCAGPFLNPRMSGRPPQEVFEEILHWHRQYGVIDFAFYDDALLIDFENHLGVVLEAVLEQDLNLRFHTPNAVHIRAITAETAGLMWRAGFKTLRLGLETSDMEWRRGLDQKVAHGEFEQAVRHLKRAGFTSGELGAYVLFGLPGQSVESVQATIEWVHSHEVGCYLSDYSPLPHTALWEKASMVSQYDLEAEPLFHNNTVLPCWQEPERARVPELRRMVKDFRIGLGSAGNH